MSEAGADPLLSELQRAMVAVVASGANDAAIAAHIVPGGTLDTAGAVDVYRAGYFARLTEQLGEIYLAVWRVLGDDEFFEQCRLYAAGHPSPSANLSDYGREFAAFLAGRSAVGEFPFLCDLARLELGFHELFHAPEHEHVPAEEWTRLAGLDGVRFVVGDAVRCFDFDHAVYEIFRHRRQTLAEVADLHRRQSIVLYKQDGEVRARELTPATARSFAALRQGHSLDEALALLGREGLDPDAGELRDFFEWLVASGVVCALRVPGVEHS